MTAADILRKSKRIVVKIGSQLLVDPERGAVHRRWLETLADDVANLRKDGKEVVIVSSGAIAVGRRQLKLPFGKLRLPEQQAAAATGMVRLAHAYQEVLGAHDLTVAQVLLTLDDSEDRRRYINARNTLLELVTLGAVPLINENDTVATDEIRFGDNDRLAARVAAMISADLLIILSDIDGLYTANPQIDPDAEWVPTVKGTIPAEIEAMAGVQISGESRGGMITKIQAARIAMGAGAATMIALGKEPHALKRVADGARATVFIPDANPRTARKEWIAGSLKPAGKVIVDPGALKALASGKSLLPAGVRGIEGKFSRGEAVAVFDTDGREIARGLIAYADEDAKRIAGHKTGEIEEILGYRGRDEMIHRDDLVLIV
jgi:glutamate 5-kinase